MGLEELKRVYANKTARQITPDDKDLIIDTLYSIQEIYNKEEAQSFLELLSLCRTMQSETNGLEMMEAITTVFSGGDEGAYVEDNSYINVRFMYELVQNVDDCQFENISDCRLNIYFDLKEDQIVLEYNEIGFKPKNVIAISGLGNSTKNHNKTKNMKEQGLDSTDLQEIGEKGIGFKSIFGLAKKVNIKSGYFNFSFNRNNVLIPIIEDYETYSGIEGTRLEIFLDEGITEKLYFYLREKYANPSSVINENPIIFLNKLTELKYETDDSYFGFRVSRTSDSKNIMGELINIEYLSSKKNENKIYQCYRYSKEITYSIDECKSRYGEDEDKERTHQIEILTLANLKNSFNGRIYSFFPTEEELCVPMIIHAPFKLNSARTKIANQSHTADSGNLWFVRTKNETIEFVHTVLQDLASKIEYKIVNFIPDDNLVRSNRCLLYDSRLSCREILKLRLFKTTDNEYLPSSEICYLDKYDISLEDSINIHKLLDIKTPLLAKTMRKGFHNYYNFKVIDNVDDRLFELSLNERTLIDKCLLYLKEYKPNTLQRQSYSINLEMLIKYIEYPLIVDFFTNETLKNIKNSNGITFNFYGHISTNYEVEKIKDYCVENKENLVNNLFEYILNSSFLLMDNIELPIYLANCIVGNNILESYTELCKKTYPAKAKNFFSFLEIDKYEKEITKLLENQSLDNIEFLNRLIQHRILQKNILGTQYKGIIKLIKEVGTKPQRFLSELLQNIDDCNYSVEPLVEIQTSSNKLIVQYNEEGFTNKHVAAITAIGDSTKKYLSSDDFTGEKGIGFKSVFNIADKVEIHSGLFHFMLTDDAPTIPKKINIKENLFGTKMIFSISNGSIDQYINDGFLCSICLCLKKIKKIKVNGKLLQIEDSCNQRIIKYEETHQYYKFDYEYCVSEINIINARYEGVNEPINQIITYLVPTETKKTYPIYSTFPTEQLLKIPIIVDANLNLNSSRENIMDNNLWNDYTFKKIYEGYLWMLDKLKKVNYELMLSILPTSNSLLQNRNLDISIIEEIKKLDIFKIFNTDNYICLNDGFIGENIEKYIIKKWGCYNGKKFIKVRKNLIDVNIEKYDYSYFNHRDFIQICNDLKNPNVYNAIRKEKMSNDEFRNMLYTFLVTPNELIDHPIDDTSDFIDFSTTSKIDLLTWEIIPVFEKKSKKITFIPYSLNIYYTIDNNPVNSNRYRILDTDKMDVRLFEKIYYDSSSTSYINIKEYTQDIVASNFYEQIEKCFEYDNAQEKAETLLRLFVSEKEIFKECYQLRRDFSCNEVYLETRSGKYLCINDCYLPCDEEDSVLNNVIVSDRYLELAQLFGIKSIKEINKIDYIYDDFDEATLLKLFKLKSLEQNTELFNQIYILMFKFEYNDLIENEIYLELISRVDRKVLLDDIGEEFKGCKTMLNSACIKKYGSILLDVFKYCKNNSFVLSNDIEMYKFTNSFILDDIKKDLETRKSTESIDLALSLVNNCYFCDMQDSLIIPIHVENGNILLINQNISSEYDVIETLKKFFLMQFSLALDISREAERYTRDGYEFISTIDYDENDEIVANRLVEYIDFNNVSEIKDFMCKPLKINNKVIGGYAKTCPICGNIVRTELTGMRLFKTKKDDYIVEIIACPNCYESLRYATSFEVNLNEIENNYLSFNAIVNGEHWSVNRIKIRLGHKAVLNKYNKK